MMNSKFKGVALVLVTFNRADLLKKAIDSVFAMSVLPDALYIIDNNSQDHTSSIVESYSHESVKIVYHQVGYNSGGAGGFAIGSQLAFNDNYEYIWLADDDILFDKACLANAKKHFKEDTILQPIRFNLDGSCAETSAVIYDLKNPFYLRPKRKSVESYYPDLQFPLSILSVPFEGPIIPRAIFEKIGFPDKRFFIFNDDLDFSIRARKSGFKILCLDDSRITRLIPFNQNIALKTWKGYFMFRSYFRIQHVYAENKFMFIRSYCVLFLAAGHSLIRLDFPSLKKLFSAFLDGRSKDFTLNKKYIP